uniref:C-type lectin domain-containing protein n=1 Tax=Labrus bergylta TaxID=56723 RepID=A0A3Q3GTG2_9LABR
MLFQTLSVNHSRCCCLLSDDVLKLYFPTMQILFCLSSVKPSDPEVQLKERPHCGFSSGPDVTFALISTSMSWTEAQSYCREHHTDLASVRNLAENQEVKQLVPPGQRVWIGLSRESWKWFDGSNSTFRNWSPGRAEPNNLDPKEDCAAADFNNKGGWEDWTCDWKRSYICHSLGEWTLMSHLVFLFGFNTLKTINRKLI